MASNVPHGNGGSVPEFLWRLAYYLLIAAAGIIVRRAEAWYIKWRGRSRYGDEPQDGGE